VWCYTAEYAVLPKPVLGKKLAFGGNFIYLSRFFSIMPELSFDEIKDGNQFEDLVVAYFRSLQNVFADVKYSGVGTDGGRDILLEFTLTDGIKHFKRKWVVQCKFHKANISTNALSDINIPTLLASYNACGYLLICREKPTSKLTDLFERLNNDGKSTHCYEIWTGAIFKSQLLVIDNAVWKHFFPNYYNMLHAIK
jgi:hypothetical protein